MQLHNFGLFLSCALNVHVLTQNMFTVG